MLKNFRKTNLALAVTAALGGGVLVVNQEVKAVNLAADGLGEVLLYPYYTVRDDWDSNIHITNTSDKAVIYKLRVREALNSREVIDFLIALSPNDMWTATLTATEDGGQLRTRDRSCTSPALFEGNGFRFVNFRNFAYAGAAADGGPTSLDRSREGYVEIIATATVDPEGEGLTAEQAALAAELEAAVTHVDGVPADCGVFVQRTATSVAASATSEYLFEPTNVTTGSYYLINVPTGRSISGNPTILANFYNPELLGSIDGTGAVGQNILFDSANTFPNLSNADPAISLLIDDTPGVGPAVVESPWVAPIDAVSAVLMRSSLINEYTVNPAVGAETDWVVTFPTKQFYADPALAGLAALPPFDDLQQFLPGANGCQEISFITYDREERSLTPLPGDGFSPQPIEEEVGFVLCFEANVITFDSSNALGSVEVYNIPADDLPGATGWLDMNLAASPNAEIQDLDGATYSGLPVIGFSATSRINSIMAGNNRNFSSSIDHAYRRDIEPASPAPNG